MRKLNKFVAVILSLVLCLSLSVLALAQDSVTITSPYENINWGSVRQYKAALHTHTNRSDGDMTLKQSVERHEETGFDIVSVTDHGSVDYGWEAEPPYSIIHGALSLVGKSEGELEPLGAAGTFSNNVSYELTKIGDDAHYSFSDGGDILCVPYGIENNAVSVNAHVNSWFVDYRNNSITTYEDAIRGVDRLNGVCVINHPGEYTKARYELHSADAYNTDNFTYSYYVNKFASLLDKYEDCIGIDINSKGDARTRFDRILWDTLLERFSAKGENVFAIGSSDAHQLDKIDTGYTVALMEEKASAALEKSLRDGSFFAASTCIGNYEELTQIAEALKANYGETNLYEKVAACARDIEDKVAKIEGGELDADESIGITFSFLDEKGYCTSDTRPEITGISVNGDEITLDTENALLVRWISNGKLLTTTAADGTPFCVSRHQGEIGDYVRAEVFGEGGILYTQAFLLNAEQKEGTAKVTEGFYIDGGLLDFLLAVFNNWFEILARKF